MSVLSSTMMISLFSLGAIAQTRSPGDDKIEVVKDYKNFDFKKQHEEYLKDQMTVKIDNTYVYNPYKVHEKFYLSQIKKEDFKDVESEDNVGRIVANIEEEKKDTDPEKKSEVKITKLNIETLTPEVKLEKNISQEEIDAINAKNLEKANEELNKSEEVVIEHKSEEVVIENKTEEVVVENKTEEAKIEDNTLSEIKDKSEEKLQDAEQLKEQAELTIVDKQDVIEAVELVEEEVAKLEDEVEKEEDSAEVKKIKEELEETKKLLAETKEALKETKKSNTIVKSKNLNLEKAYCKQQDQISTLTSQMKDFQTNIYAPIQSQMDMMMQMMMMNQFANQGFRLDPGYSSFNSQNNFGMDYGMKMFGLTELFKTGSMGGMTNNYYNVGGNFYGGAYTNSTTNPMTSAYGDFSQMYGQQNPMMQYGAYNMPYAYDFGGVNDTTNRSNFNQMDYQNFNRGPAQYYQGAPYMNTNQYAPTAGFNFI